MTLPLRLLVGVFLVASATYKVAGHLQHQPLSDVLFRREVQPAMCSSYYSLARTIQRQYLRRSHSIVEKLFRENDGVTQQMLLTASTDLCNIVHMAAENVSEEIVADCSNFQEITTNMGVFSGICLYNGDKTSFLEEMIDGVGVVNYSWNSLCSEQVMDVLGECHRNISPIIENNMEKGREHYKINLKAQERCIAGGFLQTDVSACGDVQSLTHLAHVMNLFHQLAPGVTFESSDFEPEINSDLASIADRFLDELSSCPNEDEVKSNMNIFSGLCWANGTMTSLLQELLAGFNSVDYGWDTECAELVRPILGLCGGDPIHQSKDMAAGPKDYKRIMIQQESCISSHFDAVDTVATACGDVESLKRLAHILNPLFKLGPGVTFQLSDFGLVN